jgi:cobalamin biosynthesis protein CobT
MSFNHERNSIALGKTARLLTQAGVQVTTMGARAFIAWDHTGKIQRINVPVVPRDASPEFLEVINGYLDHEVSHALETDPLAMRAIEDAFIKSSGLPEKLVRSMVNIVEDVRIEAAQEKKFRGSTRNLNAVRRHLVNEITKPALDKLDPSDIETRRAYVVVPFFRARGGQAVCETFMDDNNLWGICETYDKLFPDLAAQLKALTSTVDAANLACAILQKFPQAKAPDTTEDNSIGDDECEPDPTKKPKPSKADNNEKPSEDGDDEDEAETDDSDDAEDGDDATGEGDDEDDTADKDGEKSGAGDDEGDKEDDADDLVETGNSGDESDDEAEPDDAEGEGEGAEEDDEEGEQDGSGNADDADEDEDEDEDEGEGEGEDADAKGPPDKASDKSRKENGQSADNSDESGEADFSEDEAEDESGDDAKNGSTTESTGADEKGGDHDNTSDPGDLNFNEDAARDFDEQMAQAIENAVGAMTTTDKYRVFTYDWDKIETAPLDQETDIVDMENRVTKTSGPLRKEIERLIAARSLAIRVPGQRRGTIHPGSLHRIMTNDDRVFSRKHEARTKDTAVSLVVDLSGSMKYSDNKLNTALEAAWAFGDILNRIGVKNEIIGFTTHNNITITAEIQKEIAQFGKAVKGANVRIEPIYMPIFKSYDERFTNDTKKRLAGYSRGGIARNNIDGESVRIAASRLHAQRETRKVMIVFSDGKPHSDAGVHALSGDMKAAVHEIEKSGIETIGIGIKDTSVRDFYPKHFVIHDVSDLSGTMLGQLKRLLIG